ASAAGTEFRVRLHSSNPEPPMSAMGQKRTSRNVQPTSALPPKADMDQHRCDVRFVPKADIQARVGYDCACEDAQARGASLWNFPVDISCMLPPVPPRLGFCYATHTRSTIRCDRCV